MTDPGDVANDSPLALPMWWRPGQGRGPPQLDVTSPSENSLHKTAGRHVKNCLGTNVFLWDTVFIITVHKHLYFLLTSGDY